MVGFETKPFFKHDDYMTPKCAWENIAHLIPKDKIIWEAFYGDGTSGTHLRDLGFNTIHKPIDFFDDETLPDEYDILVSNPPFSKSKTVMDRLLELDKPFVLIMPQAKINTSYFRAWKEKGLQIIIPRKRIHFTKLVNGVMPVGWKNGTAYDCYYYCYKIGLDKDITWLS
jgi:hypothetical protein